MQLKSQIAECLWPAIPGDAGAQMWALQYQFERSQWHTPRELRTEQLAQLQRILREAAGRNACWRDALQPLRLGTDQRFGDSPFMRLPILTRADLQRLGDDLLVRKIPKLHGKLYKNSTSGSTGTPVTFYTTDVTQHFWRALTLREHLWQRRDFSGKLAAIRSNVERGEMPNWGPATENIIETGPICMLNIHTDVAQQLDWLVENNPDYLLTHPSNLKALLKLALERKVALPKLRQVRTFGELLSDEIRALCRQAWRAEIADVYSSEEAGVIAFQCERGAYHVQSENLIVEIVDDRGVRCGRGKTGRVLITSLHNIAMPLVRYEIGDYAEWGDACVCGRGLPVLHGIRGRRRNMLRLPDGTQHWPSFPEERWVHIAPIQQLQVVQTALDAIVLKIKSARALTPQESDLLIRTFQDTLRFPHPITIEPVDAIPRAANAKFEDFMSEI